MRILMILSLIYVVQLENITFLRQEENDCSPNIIVFSSGTSYLLLNVTNGTVESLPHDGLIDTMPRWSPDGQWIAFGSWRTDGEFELYIMDKSGNRLERLATGFRTVSDLHWSPDSQWIAFDSGDQLYAVNTLRDEIKQLASGNELKSVGEWSPDGTKITFSLIDPSVGYSLSLADIETGTVREITRMTDHIYDYFVSWTPDGQILLNSNRSNEGRLTLHLTDQRGSYIRQYMDRFVPSISWTPDQSRFVFMLSESIGHPNVSRQNIFVADWETGFITQITEDWTVDHENYFLPAISPNGDQIVFETWTEGDYELFILDIDGKNLRQLTFNDVHDTNPMWLPCPTV